MLPYILNVMHSVTLNLILNVCPTHKFSVKLRETEKRLKIDVRNKLVSIHCLVTSNVFGCNR